MKKKTTTAVARAAAKKPQYLVHADPPAANMEAAARINHWHSITKQAGQMAIAAALHAGMELFQAKLAHPGTFEQWIEANCDFSRITAYRYLTLVQQALGADDLPKLADSSAKKRDAAIEEFSTQTDAQTLTELYADFGIVRKAPSKMGGKREGAGRPKKNAAADEARFVYVAREMAATHSFLVPRRNGEIYAHKPPLMMWLVQAGESIFGEPFGSRLPTIVGAFLSVLAFFSIAARLAGRRVAVYAVLVACTSVRFWSSLGFGQIDALLTGLVLSAAALFLSRDGKVATAKILPAFLCAGLAMLAKGPVGLVLPVLVVVSIRIPDRGGPFPALSPAQWCLGFSAAHLVPGLWLAAAAVFAIAADLGGTFVPVLQKLELLTLACLAAVLLAFVRHAG